MFANFCGTVGNTPNVMLLSVKALPAVADIHDPESNDQGSLDRFDFPNRQASQCDSGVCSRASDFTSSPTETTQSTSFPFSDDCAQDDTVDGGQRNDRLQVVMESLAEWMVTCRCTDGRSMHPAVNDVIDANRHSLEVLDQNLRLDAQSKYVDLLIRMEFNEVLALNDVFRSDPCFEKISVLQGRIQHCTEQVIMSPAFRDSPLDLQVDSLSAVVTPILVDYVVPEPQWRAAAHLLRRDLVTVGVTTLVRGVVEALLKNLSSQSLLNIGTKISFGVIPTVLAVALLTKRIYNARHETGHWFTGAQVCRQLLALTTLTVPALVFMFGKAARLGAVGLQLVPSFLYTYSRDVAQVYLPAGQSAPQSTLGILSATVLYAGAQLTMQKLMGLFQTAASTLSAAGVKGGGGSNHTVSTTPSIYSDLSEGEESALEVSVFESLANSVWGNFPVILAAALINTGVEFLDNFFRPMLYRMGERPVVLPDAASSIVTDMDTDIDTDGNAPPSVVALQPTEASSQEAATTPSVLQSMFCNDGRRSCAFIGIIGLLHVADIYSIDRQHDGVSSVQTQDIALFLAVNFFGGLFAGGAQDVTARPDSRSSAAHVLAWRDQKASTPSGTAATVGTRARFPADNNVWSTHTVLA